MLKTILRLKYYSELGDDILQSKNIESESFVSGFDFDDLSKGRQFWINLILWMKL
jgi:hypothetical protein